MPEAPRRALGGVVTRQLSTLPQSITKTVLEKDLLYGKAGRVAGIAALPILLLDIVRCMSRGDDNRHSEARWDSDDRPQSVAVEALHRTRE